jgi:hypothetical protein
VISKQAKINAYKLGANMYELLEVQRTDQRPGKGQLLTSVANLLLVAEGKLL